MEITSPALEPVSRRRSVRVAIVCDLVEEDWSSMNLVGQMLEERLRDFGTDFSALRLCPPMKRRLTKAGGMAPKFMFNGDRVLNRFWDYPRWLQGCRNKFDLFHIVDSSYSQLVHELPADRTIVTCHDLDTFRCVLEPARERRSMPFRAMMKRTLRGFQKAAKIVCPSMATKTRILAHGLADSRNVIVVPNGVHPDFSPHSNGAADRIADELLGPPRKRDLLHVGTTIPRKRIDTLFEALALTRRQFPDVRLVQVGGTLTADQDALARRLNVRDAIVVLPHLDRAVLASVYRRCSVLLLPSEREGFGLPVVEAMACGTPVIASDIDALRETGGTAARYCPVGGVREWADAVMLLLCERSDEAAPSLESARCVKQAERFSWNAYAKAMAGLYQGFFTNWI